MIISTCTAYSSSLELFLLCISLCQLKTWLHRLLQQGLHKELLTRNLADGTCLALLPVLLPYGGHESSGIKDAKERHRTKSFYMTVVAADEPWPLGHNWVPQPACPCTKERLCDKDYRMWEFVREPTGRPCFPPLLQHA